MPRPLLFDGCWSGVSNDPTAKMAAKAKVAAAKMAAVEVGKVAEGGATLARMQRRWQMQV